MKFILSICILLGLAASAHATPETCVSSAPNGNALRVYDAPSTKGPVLGGIGVGTCGINVTNQCEGTMCVIALPGLNGWVDMRHISNSPVRAPGLAAQQAASDKYVYAVVGGSGTVTAAGITQPTPVDATGSVTIERSSAASARLLLPSEVTGGPVALKGSGAGPWTGGFGSWGGMPMNVGVTFNGLGNQSAKLVLEGKNQIASMKIALDLSAQSLPLVSQSGAKTAGTSNSSGQTSGALETGTKACTELERVTRLINRQAGTKQVQDLRGIYVLAGVTGTDPTADQAACQRALDKIAEDEGLWVLVERGHGSGSDAAQAGGLPVPRPNPSGAQAGSSLPQAGVALPSTSAGVTGVPAGESAGLLAKACVILQPLVSPLLRGQSRSDRTAVLAIFTAQGIVSVASAEPRQCAIIMADLIAAGLIVDDNRPWIAIAQTGGEDPATMISGGREIGIDPSDFIPEFDPGTQQSATSGQSKHQAAAAAGGTGSPACIKLGDVMVVAIRLGFSRDLEMLSQILKTHRVETLAPTSAEACRGALNEARQSGLTR